MFTVGQRVRATMTIYSGYGRAIGKGAEGEVMDSVPSSAKPYSVRFDVLPDLWAVTRYEIEAVATDDAATQPTQEDTMADERKFQVGQRVRAVVDIAHLDIRAGREGVITDAVGQSVGLYGVMFDNATRSYSIPASKLEPVAPDAPDATPQSEPTQTPNVHIPIGHTFTKTITAVDFLETQEQVTREYYVWYEKKQITTAETVDDIYIRLNNFGWSVGYVGQKALLYLEPKDAAARIPSRFATCPHGEDPANCSECAPDDVEIDEWIDTRPTATFPARLVLNPSDDQPAASDAPIELDRIHAERADEVLRQAVIERDALRADIETAHSEAMHYAALHGAKVAELDEAERENNALLNENMALRAERDEARAALAPFAAFVPHMSKRAKDTDFAMAIGWNNETKRPYGITFGDMRNAARLAAAAGEANDD